MRAKVQYYSEKGLYGPELDVEVKHLPDIAVDMHSAFRSLPEAEDGVRRADWTRMTIEIIRKD